MSRLLCIIHLSVYSHSLHVQVHQYMLTCMSSYSVVLTSFSLFLLSSLLLFFSVILFCHPNAVMTEENGSKNREKDVRMTE